MEAHPMPSAARPASAVRRRPQRPAPVHRGTSETITAAAVIPAKAAW